MSFSICIPTLNEEKYIGGILGCLEKQTYKDFEVIVVDGNSKDKTKEEVLKFSGKYPLSFIESPSVVFPSKGIMLQKKNDYLIFFDADVMIEDDFYNEYMRL